MSIDRPRVFISSVMDAFQPYREAARKGVIDAGGNPILIEDFPSMDASSRSACLDLVRSSDVYLAIIGDRPGSSPLGKPVVEEELEEARRRTVRRLMFLQDVTRDAATQALADRLSDYVHGRFRKTFGTPAELTSEVTAALHLMFEEIEMQIEKNDASAVEALLEGRADSNATLLRLAFVPERKDEVFDVLRFDSEEFRRLVFQLAHHDDVRLFDYEQGTKNVEVEGRDLVVTQEPRRGGSEIGVTTRLSENGNVMIEQTLTGRTKGHHDFGMDHQIAESDIGGAIRSSMAFVNSLYDKHDPGHRYSTFLFGAAIAGMNMHIVVKERRQQQSWSWPTHDEGWEVMDKPRKIDRTDFANPTEVIARTLAFIVKRYGERR